jgi:hypothetical protein
MPDAPDSRTPHEYVECSEAHFPGMNLEPHCECGLPKGDPIHTIEQEAA